MPSDVLINVNFPDCPPGEVKGIAVTAQGRRRQERLHIDKRQDGRGNPYYWIAYVRQGFSKRRMAPISPRSTKHVFPSRR